MLWRRVFATNKIPLQGSESLAGLGWPNLSACSSDKPGLVVIRRRSSPMRTFPNAYKYHYICIIHTWPPLHFFEFCSVLLLVLSFCLFSIELIQKSEVEGMRVQWCIWLSCLCTLLMTRHLTSYSGYYLNSGNEKGLNLPTLVHRGGSSFDKRGWGVGRHAKVTTYF